MTKRIILGFSGAIVVVLLLLAGSSLGAYSRADDGKDGTKAIACHDSMTCSLTDWAMKVVNTGTGHGILGKTYSSITTKAGVIGKGYTKARGVYGKSKKGVGVFGESTTSHGIKGVTNSSNYDKAAVYGISTGNAHGVYGEHNSSGHYGILGSASVGVYGKHNSGGNYGYIGGYNTGVYG